MANKAGSGQTALVTGASAGIGLDLAACFENRLAAFERDGLGEHIAVGAHACSDRSKQSGAFGSGRALPRIKCTHRRIRRARCCCSRTHRNATNNGVGGRISDVEEVAIAVSHEAAINQAWGSVQRDTPI